MLFNSYEFIFAFLPATLAGFFALGVASRTAALRWVIFASLVFLCFMAAAERSAYRAVNLDQLHFGADPAATGKR